MQVAPVPSLQLASELHDLEVLRLFLVQKAVPESGEGVDPVIGGLYCQPEVELHHNVRLKI